MLISCTICREIFVPRNHVIVTQCGHLYHEICILKWLEQKKSCPQCRAPLKTQPFRVYFNLEESEDGEADLNAKLDDVVAKLFEHQKTYAALVNVHAKSTKENAEMKARLALLEQDKENRAATIIALKTKVTSLKAAQEASQDVQAKLAAAQLEIQGLQGIKKILQGTQAEVRKAMQNLPCTEQTIQQLCTHVEVLKEKSERNGQKYKDLLKSQQPLLIKLGRLEEENRELLRRMEQMQLDIVNAKDREALRQMLPSTSSNSANFGTDPENLRRKERFLQGAENANSLELVEKNFKVRITDQLKVKRLNSATGRMPRTGIVPSKRLQENQPSTSRTSSSSSSSASSSLNFGYDGMGGSKRVSLVKPMSSAEIAAIKWRASCESQSKRPAVKKVRSQSMEVDFIDLD